MGFLAVEVNVVTQLLDSLDREMLITHFGFLESDDIRIELFDDGLKLM